MNVARSRLLSAALLAACWWPLAAEDSVEVVEEPLPQREQPAATAGEGEDEVDPIIDEARQLAHIGEFGRAAELLELYLAVHPDDRAANTLYRLIRAEERKRQLRAILSERAAQGEMVLGDPDYEIAKATAPVHIAEQLDMVEYLIEDQRYHDAVEACQRILDTHGDNEAVAILLDRLLEQLVRLERRRLERERAVRNGEVINDVIDRGNMPREPAPIPRTVLIFDEDIADAQRERLLQRLDVEISIYHDQEPLREILPPLFAAAGLNLVIVDEALGDQTLTVDVVDESIANVLEIITRSVEVSFNYHGGSVYVTSPDTPVLRSEIIRLRSGLLDTQRDTSLGGGGGEGGGEEEAGGGGFDPFGGLAGGGGNGGQGQGGNSDLERFLAAALTDGGLVAWPEGSFYYVDYKSNTLFVRSAPATIAETRRLLHALDYNSVQVRIEARFVLVETTALDELGVDWGVVGEDGDVIFGGAQGANAVNPFGATSGTLGGQLFNGSPGVRIGSLITGNDLNVSARLSALEQRGQANVFSEPQIMTVNNARGSIEFVNEVKFIEDFENRAVGASDVDATNDTVVTEQQNVLIPIFGEDEERISLNIQPSVARNADVVTLFLQPVVRQLIGFEDAGAFTLSAGATDILGSSSIREPVFQERRLATTMHVQNGQTIVLGGLIEERDNRNRSGIPYLSRIPALGTLFGTRSSDVERRKLLIFITAHIVDPSGARHSEEVRHLRDVASASLPAAIRRQIMAERELEAERRNDEIEESAATRDSDRRRPSDRLRPGGQRRD